MRSSEVSLLVGLLVPISTFLILQSVFGEIHWIQWQCLTFDSKHLDDDKVTCSFSSFLNGFLSIIVLVSGVVATACCIVRNLELKIKWMTRALITGMYAQGILGCLVALYNFRKLKLDDAESITNGISGIGLFTIGSLLSLNAAVVASYHQHKRGGEHAYIYCVHDIPVCQRGALFLFTAMFIYLSMMSATYCLIENWSFGSSLYWSVSSLSTIGLGDITPKTSLGKALSSLWTIVGVALIGAAIMALRKAIVDDIARKMEMTYFNALGFPTNPFNWEQGHTRSTHRKRGLGFILEGIWGGSLMNGSNYADNQTEVSADEGDIETTPFLSTVPAFFQKSITNSDPQRIRKEQEAMRLKQRNSIACTSDPAQLPLEVEEKINDARRRNTTFGELVEPIFESQFKKGKESVGASFRKLLTISLAYFIFHVISFGILFAMIEGWSYADGVYFSYNTISTIGYGDYFLKKPLSRTMFVWFVLLGSVSLTHLFSVVFKAVGRVWSDTEYAIENRVFRYHTKAMLKKNYLNQLESSIKTSSQDLGTPTIPRSPQDLDMKAE